MKSDPFYNQWEDFDDSAHTWTTTEVPAVHSGDCTPLFDSSFARKAGLPCARTRAAALCTGAKAAKARGLTVSCNASCLHAVRVVVAKLRSGVAFAQPVAQPFGAPDTWLNNVGRGIY